jgi:hypothetical protein
VTAYHALTTYALGGLRISLSKLAQVNPRVQLTGLAAGAVCRQLTRTVRNDF